MARKPRKSSPPKGVAPKDSDQTRSDATEARKQRFLACYPVAMTVTGACRSAEIHPDTVYEWLKSDPGFKPRMDQARSEGIQRWEAIVAARAFEGTRKLKICNGQAVIDPRVPVVEGKPPTYLEEVEYSDVLAQFMLRAAAPEKYRERAEVRHVGGIGVAVNDSDRKAAREVLSDPAARAALIAAAERAAEAEDQDATGKGGTDAPTSG